MIANIIYDDRRVEDYEPMITEMVRQDISYVLWPAVLLSKVVDSINAAHKAIVSYANDNGLPEICIMEQDVWFPADDGWDYFLKSKPREFDIYVAGNYGGTKYYFNSGFHCYIVKRQYYATFLAKPNDVHIDNCHTTADIKICYPYAALQRESWSANNREIVNYNSCLKPEDIYYGSTTVK